jgi:hypothetical protein
MRETAGGTAAIAAAAGTVLVVATSALGGTWSLALVAFVLWALLPYGLLALAGSVLPDAWSAGGAGAAMLVVEAGVRASVFLYPRGSIAAVALVFSPILVGMSAVPGAVGGWVLGWAWRTGSALLRLAGGLAAASVLGLTVLGLARPELFPTAVWRRRSTLARIGEPRVVLGGDAFEIVPVSDRAAWHVAGRFDEGPGELVAVVDNRGADLLDPADFRRRGHADFGPVRGGIWNWFSTLVRMDGRLVVVQTGGGYSDVKVQELDGRVLWSYRPDPNLPPTALRPADLDGDGTVEFYASDHDATVRLDAAGREVWRRPTSMAHLVGVAARSGGSPAWVVAVEYARRARIWDETGAPLAELPLTAQDNVFGTVDWPETRAIVLGGATVRGIALDGKPLFEMPLGDFFLSDVLAVRFTPAGRPHLALVGATPRDVGRWRLLVLSSDQKVVYDEILDRSVRLLKARRADGGETLFMSGNGLRALRPRG